MTMAVSDFLSRSRQEEEIVTEMFRRLPAITMCDPAVPITLSASWQAISTPHATALFLSDRKT
jgi:hypothetical protein